MKLDRVCSLPLALTLGMASFATFSTAPLPGGNVPKGYEILGETPQAPPSYAFAGPLSSVTHQKVRADVPSGDATHCASRFAGNLFVFGGTTTSGAPSGSWKFDPSANSWTAIAPMPTDRTNASAATSNGRIYVFGGFVPLGGARSVVEEYDPLTNSWATKSSMPTARFGTAAVASPQGRIYVIGGAGHSTVATVESYDPVSDSWMTHASMANDRYLFGAAWIEGRICVAGGLQAGSITLSSIEAYDPVADSWSPRAPLQIARYANAAAAIGGRLVTFGGDTTSGGTPPLSSVELYDPSTDSSEIDGSMLMPRNYFSATSIGTTILLIGGCDAGCLFVTSSVEEYTPSKTWYVFRKI